MVEQELLVNFDEMREQVRKFDKNLTIFEPYGDKFLGAAKTHLDSSNTEFTKEIKETITTMCDTKAKDLVTELREYSEHIKGMLDSYEATDQMYTGKSKEESN